MKRFHIALNVKDLQKSIHDYSRRLGRRPSVVIKEKYALWRTASLNFSIRVAKPIGRLRHLGWEDPKAKQFTVSKDVNGVAWERFTVAQQKDEVQTIFRAGGPIES